MPASHTAAATTALPILYSFRRCPYAIRARLAIAYAEQSVELREVVLKDKPAALLEISPKGTVPVLQLHEGSVIEESREIMLWALQKNDPHAMLNDGKVPQGTEALLRENDGEFKHWLDRYKYADRYPEHSAQHYRELGEIFLEKLEQRLRGNTFLCDSKATLADIGIMPFIRQFAFVDRAWFEQAPYPALRAWLYAWLERPQFTVLMKKYAQWQSGDTRVVLQLP